MFSITAIEIKNRLKFAVASCFCIWIRVGCGISHVKGFNRIHALKNPVISKHFNISIAVSIFKY
jgi:hypothetical protein